MHVLDGPPPPDDPQPRATPRSPARGCGLRVRVALSIASYIAASRCDDGEEVGGERLVGGGHHAGRDRAVERRAALGRARLGRDVERGLRTAHGSRRALAPCRSRAPPTVCVANPRSRACATSSCTRRVLPMPGSARDEPVAPPCLPASTSLRAAPRSAPPPRRGRAADARPRRPSRSERSFHTGISLREAADRRRRRRGRPRWTTRTRDTRRRRARSRRRARARANARRGSPRRRSPCSCDARRCRCRRRRPRRSPRRRAPRAARRPRGRASPSHGGSPHAARSARIGVVAVRDRRAEQRHRRRRRCACRRCRRIARSAPSTSSK